MRLNVCVLVSDSRHSRTLWLNPKSQQGFFLELPSWCGRAQIQMWSFSKGDFADVKLLNWWAFRCGGSGESNNMKHVCTILWIKVKGASFGSKYRVNWNIWVTFAPDNWSGCTDGLWFDTLKIPEPATVSPVLDKQDLHMIILVKMTKDNHLLKHHNARDAEQSRHGTQDLYTH